MNKPSFVHLHLHTQYSILDGACRVDDIMETAAAHEMPAVAITDHGVMYGVVPFYKAARATGVKAIIGCEMYMAIGSRLDRSVPESRSVSNHLVLLAQDEAGYKNLIKLVSAAHLEGFYYKPRIDMELLAKHSAGLIGLSSCLKGAVADALLQSGVPAAMKVAGEYQEILGRGKFFLEVQDHLMPEQRKVNAGMLELHRKTGMPLVGTNDVHYLERQHARAHEVLLCLQTQTVLSDPKRMKYPSDEFYMKSPQEMAALFKDFPGAIENTVEIAAQCDVKMEFGKSHFPIFKVPEGFNQKSYLIHLCREGLASRYGLQDPDHPKDDRERELVQRYQYELGVIEKTKFINYYLVVWDFVHFARSHGIPVGPGRGSGAGSLIAYVLGITGIDPLQYGLIFERFLNPERVSPPDFDIDFCQARRGEVIEYVKDKYGRDNVAQIITFNSLGAKNVIRDVGRVLEIPYADCDRLSKMVPDDPKMTLTHALEVNPEFKKAYESDANAKRILDFAFVLEGLCRNPGTHAAGVVIGEQPLVEIIPLARDKDKEIITQYAMEPLGEIGLLKMDFLGLKTLTVIQEVVDLLARTRGVKLDENRIPMDDQATYELLRRGDTVGVFQLESSGMRDLVRRVGLSRIEDLIAMVALYRPGPMNMLDDYVNRKTGKTKIVYDHPLLAPILEETYGVMLYQEQVQRAANVLAGYSLGQGDILRRAMGKKKAEEMEKQRSTFVAGCAKTNNIPAKTAEKIFDTLAKFAGYGFNKSHSAAYGIVAFWTAYLKAHYPAEFMSALLSSEMGNADKLPVFIREVREMGLKMHAPDINHSLVRFMPAEDGVRFGLAGIKNVGEGAADVIARERVAGGPYKSLVDLCARIDGQLVNKKVLESLVRAGACDTFGMHRARLFNGIDYAMNRAAGILRDKRSGQGSLFGDAGGEPTGSPAELPDCEPWHQGELLANEKELLGFYMSGHPLSEYASLLERYQLTDVAGLAQLADGTPTRIGGLASKIAQKITKKKEAMAVLELETLDGSVEVVVYPESYRQYQALLQPEAAILICGEVRQEERPKLIAAEIYRLDDAPRYFAMRLSVRMAVANMEDRGLNQIKELLLLHPGNTPVIMCLEFASGPQVFVEVGRALAVAPAEDLIRQLEHVAGEGAVYVSVNPKPCLRGRNGRNGAGMNYERRNGGN